MDERGAACVTLEQCFVATKSTNQIEKTDELVWLFFVDQGDKSFLSCSLVFDFDDEGVVEVGRRQVFQVYWRRELHVILAATLAWATHTFADWVPGSEIFHIEAF